MVVSNNISSSLQSLCVTDFVCQDIVIHWLMLFFIKLLYKARCHIYVPEIFLCTWTHTVIGCISVPEVTLCMDTYCLDEVVDWDVIVHDWWRHSMCLVAYHNCSWSCYSFAVDHTYVLQLRDVIGHITLEKCFNLKHCHFIEYHHWCHRQKQCSSFVLNFMEQDYWTRLLAKFIVIFYIWCCYSIVAYVHLRLRLQLQHLHPSVYNYIDYSSAVDLDALHCE